MGAGRVRRFGPAGRTTTALLAAGLGIVSPLAVALPGWAQTTSNSSANSFYATPPPVDESALIQDTQKPDKTYVKKKECVQRSTLGETVVLNNRPWGQEYLQITKAQEIVRAATGHVGAGVKVGVIDTGVTQHPWFQDRLVGGGDYVQAPQGKQPGLEDCDGHGTEVAGIIASEVKVPAVPALSSWRPPPVCPGTVPPGSPPPFDVLGGRAVVDPAPPVGVDDGGALDELPPLL